MRRVAGLAALVGIMVAHVAWAAPSAVPTLKGGWHPVLGSGAVYDMQTGDEPVAPWEIAVVGEEAGGHWVEMRVQSPEGELVTKSLVTPTGVKRMIVKMGQEPAMEMPAMAAMVKLPESGIEHQAPVGRESIATPAGTFMCEHYQVTDQDVWINPDVSPYGLVKASGPKLTMTLRQTLRGVTSRITETPQQMPGMQQLFGQGGAPSLPRGLLGDEQQ